MARAVLIHALGLTLTLTLALTLALALLAGDAYNKLRVKLSEKGVISGNRCPEEAF